LPELIEAAANGSTIVIVEGEAKADLLRRWNIPATCNSEGAKHWRPEHSAYLSGADVVVLPDNDEAGRKHSNAVARSLTDAGAAVRVLDLPGLPPKGDIIDWTAAGGTADELHALIASRAKSYEVHAAAGGNGADDPADEPPGQAVKAAAPNPIKLLSYAEMVSLPPAEWLIDFVLPMRSKSVLFGLSDSFKSFLAIAMACAVSTGRTWHGAAVKRCKVIYLANEGAIGVGRKRIPAWMAANEIPDGLRANIFLVKADAIIPDAKSRANLIAAIRERVEPGETFLLIIDVLRGTMSGSESDDEAANAWTMAAESLVTEGASILAVTHSPYGDDGRMRGHSHLWGSFDTRLQAEGDKEKLTTVLKVNRHKDHDSKGEWGFKLVEQAIPEHKGETSLVPLLDGEVKAAMRSKRSKGKGEPSLTEIIGRQYLETLDRLADGVEKSPGFDFKAVRKVSTDAIRDDMKSRGILDKNPTMRGGLTNAARTALSKAKAGLINSGKLIEKDELIWRPNP
jgi:hypothetical protein